MREIVGAKIGTRITNSLTAIKQASQDGTLSDLLDRKRMQFMAGMDLGRNWEIMAAGPTLFFIDDDGNFHAPNVKVSGPEAALSPEGRARLPGSAAGDSEKHND